MPAPRSSRSIVSIRCWLRRESVSRNSAEAVSQAATDDAGEHLLFELLNRAGIGLLVNQQDIERFRAHEVGGLVERTA